MIMLNRNARLLIIAAILAAIIYHANAILLKGGNAGDSSRCSRISRDVSCFCGLSRRHVIQSTASIGVSSLISTPSLASDIARTTSTSPFVISPDEATVTNKVFMDVRISRQDGTFYVRDDLPNTPENQVFACRLTMGLFGKSAPTHVERFLSYIQSGYDGLDDNPLPTYGRSVFPSFDQNTGVLQAGFIPSLEYTELGGNSVLKYNGRLLPASLWLEQDRSLPRISHTAKGLLTHRNLDVMPSFGVTTRTDTTMLDKSHTIFGRILLNDESRDFLNRVSELPTYSIDRPSSYNDPDSVVDDAAKAIFSAQRTFFRSAAKGLGDTRVGKIYEGKLLRRVEVTQVGIL